MGQAVRGTHQSLDDAHVLYFAAPVFGMAFAAEVYLRTGGATNTLCAKLHHENPQRCIFCGKPAGMKRNISSLHFSITFGGISLARFDI
jgi:hypothetical protein